MSGAAARCRASRTLITEPAFINDRIVCTTVFGGESEPTFLANPGANAGARGFGAVGTGSYAV